MGAQAGCAGIETLEEWAWRRDALAELERIGDAMRAEDERFRNEWAKFRGRTVQ